MSIVTTQGGSSVGVNSSSSSTDNHLVRWDGVSGDMIQDGSAVTLDDAGAMVGLTSVTMSGTLDVTGAMYSRATGLSMHMSIQDTTGKGYIEWRTTAGTRTGWFGKGGSGNNNITLMNEHSGSGSITLQANNGYVILNNYCQIGGTSAPKVKMKHLTGTTGSTQGSTVSVAHGITASKIIGLQVLVDSGAGTDDKMCNGYTEGNGYQYSYFSNVNNVVVQLQTGNSANILSKGFSVVVTYIE